MSSLQEAVQANLRAVNERITQAARAAGRPPQGIALVAVSKTFPAEAVLAVAAGGQVDFGENYVQEAVAKIARVRELAPHLALRWHYIGPIQSNKTRDIAEQFNWVQSVDRLKVAQRLSQQRPAECGPLNVLLQVNISGEASKSGVAPEDVAALASAVAALPNLALRGLMAIPEPAAKGAPPAQSLREMKRLFNTLRQQHPQCDTLSLGMTADLEAAVAAGSTMVRVGTAIFGERARTAA